MSNTGKPWWKHPFWWSRLDSWSRLSAGAHRTLVACAEAADEGFVHGGARDVRCLVGMPAKEQRQVDRWLSELLEAGYMHAEDGGYRFAGTAKDAIGWRSQGVPRAYDGRNESVSRAYGERIAGVKLASSGRKKNVSETPDSAELLAPEEREEKIGEQREERDGANAPEPPLQPTLPGTPAATPSQPKGDGRKRSEVFDAWVTAFKKGPNAKMLPGDKRDKAIKARLAEGATIDDLIQCVLGYAKDPWRHEAPVNCELATLLRDRGKVETGMEMFTKGVAAKAPINGNGNRPQQKAPGVPAYNPVWTDKCAPGLTAEEQAAHDKWELEKPEGWF